MSQEHNTNTPPSSDVDLKSMMDGILSGSPTVPSTQPVAPSAPPVVPDQGGNGSSQPAGGSGTPQADSWTKHLVEATGGKVSTIEDLNRLMEQSSQLTPLQARVQELEAQSKLSPFVNDFVRDANEFFKQGGTPDEYYRLIEFSKIKVDDQSDLDVIRTKYQFENPGLDNSGIDALIKKDIGDFDGEAREEGGEKVVNPAVKAELYRQGRAAREWVKGQQSKFATPQAALQSKTDAAREQALNDQWGSLVQYSVGSMDKLDLKVDGVEEGLQFPVPKEVLGPVMESVRQFAVQAYKNGQLQANQAAFETEIKPALQQWAQNLIYMQMGPQIVAAAAKHAAAATEKRIRAEVNGSIPPNPSGRTNNNPIVNAARKEADAFFGMQ